MNENYSATVRACAIRIYGKLGNFISVSNQYFTAIKTLLVSLVSMSSHTGDEKDKLICYSSVAALCTFGVLHYDAFNEIKTQLAEKMGISGTGELGKLAVG